MSARSMTPEKLRKLVASGYRRTSNRFGLISRVDRKDWFEWLNERHFGGRLKPEEKPNWADFYRRIHSKDTLEVGQYYGRKVPSSNGDATGYVPRVK